MDILVQLWRIYVAVCGLSGNATDDEGCIHFIGDAYFTSQEACMQEYPDAVQEKLDFTRGRGWYKTGQCEELWVPIYKGNWKYIEDDE